MNGHDSNTNKYQTIIVLLVVVVTCLSAALLYVLVNNYSNSTHDNASSELKQSSSTIPLTQPETEEKTAPEPQVTCEDVTSYDYDWSNDVLCTNPDGTQFYTDYAGAEEYGYNF